jgi:hypothetical protein
MAAAPDQVGGTAGRYAVQSWERNAAELEAHLRGLIS